MPTSSELKTAIRVLEAFREIDPAITLPSMLAFLYYAEKDGEPGNQYRVFERLDMSSATASRATAYWFKWRRPKEPGADMLESMPDPEDRRYRLVTLNRRGVGFVEKIEEAVSYGT